MNCPICKNIMTYTRKKSHGLENTEVYYCETCFHSYYETLILNHGKITSISNIINYLDLYSLYPYYNSEKNEKLTIKRIFKKIEKFNEPRTWKECFKTNKLDMRTNRCKNCYNLFDCVKLRELQQQIIKRAKQIEKELII